MFFIPALFPLYLLGDDGKVLSVICMLEINMEACYICKGAVISKEMSFNFLIA